MRVLVTGGAGYIGSHAVRRLLAHGHDVHVFDSLSMGHRAAVPVDRLTVGDLGDADHLDHVLLMHRTEAVVHFAAYAYVGESVLQPARYYWNNLHHGLVLLERMRRQGISKFVFSSSCSTYGVPDRVPIFEDSPQRPVSPYGWTKLALEQVLLDYARAYGWTVAVLRYFNAAGAAADGSLGEDHTPETHLIPLVLKVALGLRQHIDIFGTDYPTRDGTCVRDYVHVDDLAEAHCLAMEQLQPGAVRIFNVGIGAGYSVREVIETARSVTGKPIPVREGPRRAGDPAELIADSTRIRTSLGWTPKYGQLRPIIETAWNWMKNHPNGYSK
jgi:UDP-glucose-4-epimerase GalE